MNPSFNTQKRKNEKKKSLKNGKTENTIFEFLSSSL